MFLLACTIDSPAALWDSWWYVSVVKCRDRTGCNEVEPMAQRANSRMSHGVRVLVCSCARAIFACSCAHVLVVQDNRERESRGRGEVASADLAGTVRR
jgi:hypothetical protein